MIDPIFSEMDSQLDYVDATAMISFKCPLWMKKMLEQEGLKQCLTLSEYMRHAAVEQLNRDREAHGTQLQRAAANN